MSSSANDGDDDIDDDEMDFLAPFFLIIRSKLLDTSEAPLCEDRAGDFFETALPKLLIGLLLDRTFTGFSRLSTLSTDGPKSQYPGEGKEHHSHDDDENDAADDEEPGGKKKAEYMPALVTTICLTKPLIMAQFNASAGRCKHLLTSLICSCLDDDKDDDDDNDDDDDDDDDEEASTASLSLCVMNKTRFSTLNK